MLIFPRLLSRSWSQRRVDELISHSIPTLRYSFHHPHSSAHHLKLSKPPFLQTVGCTSRMSLVAAALNRSLEHLQGKVLGGVDMVEQQQSLHRIG